MAVLALGLVGAGIGGLIAPGIGASIGFGVGQVLGGMLFAKTQRTEQVGPRLQDLTVMVSTYGVGIPQYWGTARGSGNVIYYSGTRETESVRTEEVGGKGGGGTEVTTRTYSYDCDIAVAIAQTTDRFGNSYPIAGVRKIWANGKLIYNVGDNATVDDIVQSNLAAQNIRFYLGTETQLPDPTIEAEHGAGNVPAFRGLAYVMFKGLDLDPYGGQPPNFTFEIVASQTPAALATPIIYTHTGGYATYGIYAYPHGHSTVYAVSTGNGGYGTELLVLSSATGALLSRRVLDTQILHYAGTTNLSTGRPAPNGKGDYWALLFGTLGGYNGFYLFRFSSDGSAQQVIRAGDYGGGGPNVHQLGIWDGKIYFQLGGDFVYKIDEDSAPTHVGGVTSLAHRVQVGTLPTGYRGMAPDRDGCPWWIAINGTTATLVRQQPDTVVTVGTIAGFNTADFFSGGSSQLRNIAWDIDNQPWVPWFEGSGANRHAVLKRLNRSTAAVVQTITLPDIGGSANSGLGEFVFAEDGYLYVNYSATNPQQWRKVDPATGEIVHSTVNASTNQSDGGSLATPYAVVFGSQYTGAFTSTIKLIEPLPRIAVGGGPTLATVVSQVCEAVGLAGAEIDVASLTDTVDGFIRARPMPARTVLETLASGFIFDAVESGSALKFVRRGSSSVVSIPADDVGASLGDSDSDTPLLEITRRDEPQVPRQVTVRYFDKSNDYQQGAEYARRLVTRSKLDDEIELPIVMSANKAANVAEELLYALHDARTPIRFATGIKYARYEPTDIATVTDGVLSHVVRIVSKREQLPLIEWEAVLEGPAKTPTSKGASSVVAAQSVGLSGPTELFLLDIPILRYADDDPGLYAAVAGSRDSWRGTVLFDSPDNSGYAQIASVTKEAINGTATTALGASPGNVIDTGAGVEVNLTRGTLSSVSDLDMCNGANLALLGGELFQFASATLISGTTYRLTRLLRGRKGTEAATSTHYIGERFIFLSAGGVVRVPRTTAQIGVMRYYKAVSIGETLAMTGQRALAHQARGLKPFSPVHLSAQRNVPATNDWSVKWVRRGRIDADWRDRVDVPIGESSESYRIQFINTISLAVVYEPALQSGTTFTLTAAQQTTSYGGAQSTIRVRVAMVSAVVGDGYETEGTFSG